MPERRTCDYTGEDIEPGTGIMYVRRDGTVLHFKDSKAEKNYFMGREAADLEWTGAGAAAGADADGDESEAAAAEPEEEAVTEDDEREETRDGAADAEDDEAVGGDAGESTTDAEETEE
ncbi:MAG: 50S ribosomal protein L24e [Halobacteriaceae archaeon]